MQLIDLLHPTRDRLWPLIKQCGVDEVAILLDGGEQDQRMFQSVGADVRSSTPAESLPWGEAALARSLDKFKQAGLKVVVIEDTPPLDLARMGRPGRDEQIENVLTQVRAMGALGIPVLCYNWMAVTSWARTSTAVPARGGALVTGYDAAAADTLETLAVEDETHHEQLWAGLQYFLDAVVPEADRQGVRLAMHPDDPPLPVVRGVPRIMSTHDAFRRLIGMADSPANSITLCQGNFALMDGSVVDAIDEFGSAGRIAYVHMRDVKGTRESFVETFHDDGQTDLKECMVAYDRVGFRGPYRPDHVPTMSGERNNRPGYGRLGRLFALGYLRGLEHAIGATK